MAHGVKRLVTTANAAAAATGRFPRRLRGEPENGFPNRFMATHFENRHEAGRITDPRATIRATTLRIG